MTPARITTHAIDRYRVHHPEAERPDVLAAFQAGREEPPALIRELLGRRRALTPTDRYVSAPDGAGVFVFDAAGGVVITYLRLQPSQRAVLAGVPEAPPVPRWPLDVPAEHVVVTDAAGRRDEVLARLEVAEVAPLEGGHVAVVVPGGGPRWVGVRGPNGGLTIYPEGLGLAAITRRKTRERAQAARALRRLEERYGVAQGVPTEAE